MPTPISPSELLAAPIGDLISAIGRGIADAQGAMDAQTIENLRAVYTRDGALFEVLRAIGYRPTWYHIPEVTAEVSVALTLRGEASSSGSQGSAGLVMYAAPIDAAYTSRFNYDLQAASVVKFRVVPVPPSAAAEALRVAPKIVGISVAAARALLQSFGIPLELAEGLTPADADLIEAQSPEAGTVLASVGVRVTKTKPPT
jgi:hypothetical protein